MSLIFWPYKMGSDGCKQLARELHVKRVYHNGKYTPKARHVIINWGNGMLPKWWPLASLRMTRVLNKPSAVVIAANKLSTFQQLQNKVTIPSWTTDKDTAYAWLENGHRVFCRKLLTSKGGNGIVLVSPLQELVDAPLYTKEFPVHTEYRVHVVENSVVDIVQKRKLSTENLRQRGITFNPDVRNHTNGWVFARLDMDVPQIVHTISVEAVKALGLDFGAVDVAVDAEGTPCVFEINTAPGLEGTTLQNYKQAFERIT